MAWTMGIPKDSGTDVTSFAQFRFPSVTHSDTFKLGICSKTVHRIIWVSALANEGRSGAEVIGGRSAAGVDLPPKT